MNYREGRSFKFTDFLLRLPGKSVVNGIRKNKNLSPKLDIFLQQHLAYSEALLATGGNVTFLPALEQFPDSVFIEDAALVSGNNAVLLRPGAKSRTGEAVALLPSLVKIFTNVHRIPAHGYIDGGDILLTDTEAFIGLSSRTNEFGYNHAAKVLSELEYAPRKVYTPPKVLHFKSECGILDSETLICTQNLAEIDCFHDYRVLLTPQGEEAAANLIRVNDTVLIGSGHPKTEDLLSKHGYKVKVLDISEAAKLDGGLSCMSLRFNLA